MEHRLPIGSVVSVFNSKEMLMIIGYNLMKAEENIVYDYAAYSYPIGFIGIDTEIKLFNDSAIELLYHKGLDNENFINYLTLLAEKYDEEKGVNIVDSAINYVEL